MTQHPQTGRRVRALEKKATHFLRDVNSPELDALVDGDYPKTIEVYVGDLAQFDRNEIGYGDAFVLRISFRKPGEIGPLDSESSKPGLTIKQLNALRVAFVDYISSRTYRCAHSDAFNSYPGLTTIEVLLRRS